ncbi:uncharacterized protein FIBRA_03139 [Fibroporia radiculosa]|uniref:Uncharacterized protein n=1 Tax=Fibroporia radiculosa TaxID=599839 RepID=J4I9F9_9APHY|nr:uncharacterized protein FIBRA_03139 [Fibroporia radiculosa]CCM01091.1 predicted protein [Fibroporia radiculosa]
MNTTPSSKDIIMNVDGMSPQTLEDEICGYLRIVAKLRRQLNTFAPISRLPPEVLAQVFIHHIDQSLNTLRIENFYKWVQITHVCSHWRIVALAFPRVWSCIWIPISLTWMNEMITRSKSVPLSINAVYLSFGAEADRAELNCVASELMGRLQSLKLRSSPYMHQKFWEQVKEPAPLLQSLILINEADYGGSDASNALNLPILLTPNRAPQLHKLEVHNYPNCWENISYLGSLRDLVLCNEDNEPDTILTTIPMAQLFSELEKLPRLESLTLDRAFHLTTPDILAKSYSLPHIHSLSLGGDLSECTEALSHLTLPPGVSFKLSIHTSGGNVQKFAQVVAEKINPLAAKPLGVLCVHETNDDLHIRAYSREKQQLAEHIRNATTPSDPVNTHEWEWSERQQCVLDLTISGHANMPGMVLCVCKTLPILEISFLFLSGHVVENDEVWLEAFGRLERLTILWVHADWRRTASALPEPLLGRMVSHTDEPGTPYYFPKLRVLKLDGVYFQSLQEHCDEIRGTFFESLLNGLATRSRRGCPVPSLILRKCINLLEDDVNELSQYVKKLSWDKLEQFDDDHDYASSY